MKERQTRVRQAFRTHFIPHEGNNYHPHMLHAKRTVFYGSLFLGMKAFAIACAMVLPRRAYLAPNVLAAQQARIIALTNELRGEKGVHGLGPSASLERSAFAKADDMATVGYFSHKSPSGHGLSYFLVSAGYRYSTAGENLAMGFPDAANVVDAWMKSPTHYANLVDATFHDVGVGMEEGMFEGKPTVFVAQHFGLPLAAAVPNEPDEEPVQKEILAAATVPAKPVVKPVVKPTVKVVSAPVPVIPKNIPAQSVSVIPASSTVAWTDTSDHRTKVDVEVVAQGNVSSVGASVEGYPVALHETEATGTFTGTLTIPASSDTVFKTVTPPHITVTGKDGVVVHESVDWAHPKIVEPSGWQKYLQARDWFALTPSVFSVSHWIYFGFMIFFIVVLVMSMVIEIRKQHPHMIMRTLGLIGMIFVFWRF